MTLIMLRLIQNGLMFVQTNILIGLIHVLMCILIGSMHVLIFIVSTLI